MAVSFGEFEKAGYVHIDIFIIQFYFEYNHNSRITLWWNNITGGTGRIINAKISEDTYPWMAGVVHIKSKEIEVVDGNEVSSYEYKEKKSYCTGAIISYSK